MAPELVRELSYQLQQFALPESVTAIICGVDLEGTHIMVVRGSHIEDRDAVGFAAIGIGDWHANSQFMFEKHTYFRSFTETLLLTYTAKRRAEVAPGVGLATDMFTVGPLLGNHVYPIGEHVLNKLAVIHSGVNAKIKES